MERLRKAVVVVSTVSWTDKDDEYIDKDDDEGLVETHRLARLTTSLGTV